jgi:hypothetical protein
MIRHLRTLLATGTLLVLGTVGFASPASAAGVTGSPGPSTATPSQLAAGLATVGCYGGTGCSSYAPGEPYQIVLTGTVPFGPIDDDGGMSIDCAPLETLCSWDGITSFLNPIFNVPIGAVLDSGSCTSPEPSTVPVLYSLSCTDQNQTNFSVRLLLDGSLANTPLVGGEFVGVYLIG